MGLPGNLTCFLEQTCLAVLDSHLFPPFLGLEEYVSTRYCKASAALSVIFLWHVLVYGVAGITLDFGLPVLGDRFFFFLAMVALYENSCNFVLRCNFVHAQ